MRQGIVWAACGACQRATPGRSRARSRSAQLQTFTGPWNDQARDPRAALPWIGMYPRIDERAKARHRKHGFKDESDTVVMMFDRNEPGWFAVRNYTVEALKLQAALIQE